MTVEQIPTTVMMGRSVITHDPASRDYPVRGFITYPLRPRHDRTWRRGQAYNQGPTSTCVGQTLKGVLNTAPWANQVPYRVRTRYDALEIYRGAQEHDQWEGVDYEGTSALGACKWLHKRGLIAEYRWCFSLEDVLDTLVQHGPVALGVWWYEGMWETDAFGVLHVIGDRVGGHEVELHGIDVGRRLVIGTNSWGIGWGANGRFRMHWNDLERLLHEDGDAVTVVQGKPAEPATSQHWVL